MPLDIQNLQNMQLSHYAYLKKILDTRNTASKSVEFIKNLKDTRSRSDYQNEYNRLRGDLASTILPMNSYDLIMQRNSKLKELGAQAIREENIDFEKERRREMGLSNLKRESAANLIQNKARDTVREIKRRKEMRVQRENYAANIIQDKIREKNIIKNRKKIHEQEKKQEKIRQEQDKKRRHEEERTLYMRRVRNTLPNIYNN